MIMVIVINPCWILPIVINLVLSVNRSQWDLNYHPRCLAIRLDYFLLPIWPIAMIPDIQGD